MSFTRGWFLPGLAALCVGVACDVDGGRVGDTSDTDALNADTEVFGDDTTDTAGDDTSSADDTGDDGDDTGDDGDDTGDDGDDTGDDGDDTGDDGDDTGDDGDDTGDDGGLDPSDPFNPASCDGPPLTAAGALALLDGATRVALDRQLVMERRRTCTADGCSEWGEPTVNELSYLTWSGGSVTRYKKLETDTHLVLYNASGTPRFSVRHHTHRAQYPTHDHQGLVFEVDSDPISWPLMRAYYVSSQHQYDYRDLEQHLGRNGTLYVSESCARFVAATPANGSPITVEYAALYTY